MVQKIKEAMTAREVVGRCMAGGEAGKVEQATGVGFLKGPHQGRNVHQNTHFCILGARFARGKRLKTNVVDAHRQPTTMVHRQPVSFDRDPYLWLTHTVPSASHARTEPTLLATRVALSTAGLATVTFFSSNPQIGPKHDRRDRGEWNHSAPYFEGRNYG